MISGITAFVLSFCISAVAFAYFRRAVRRRIERRRQVLAGVMSMVYNLKLNRIHNFDAILGDRARHALEDHVSRADYIMMQRLFVDRRLSELERRFEV